MLIFHIRELKNAVSWHPSSSLSVILGKEHKDACPWKEYMSCLLYLSSIYLKVTLHPKYIKHCKTLTSLKTGYYSLVVCYFMKSIGVQWLNSYSLQIKFSPWGNKNVCPKHLTFHHHIQYTMNSLMLCSTWILQALHVSAGWHLQILCLSNKN